MSLLLTAFEVAAKAQAEVMVLTSAGAMASALGLLTPANLPSVSKLQIQLYARRLSSAP